ncbi:hypothetical protein [Streptomyces bauhiniae]|uniref:hypothetical protein n=1 Tax=Streptomyces bauhiniae TaxID=2340725 RepID=UPI0035D792F5
MGGASLTPQELRRLAEMENGLGEDETLTRRLSIMRVPGGPGAWGEAAERAGHTTPWPMDPSQV